MARIPCDVFMDAEDEVLKVRDFADHKSSLGPDPFATVELDGGVKLFFRSLEHIRAIAYQMIKQAVLVELQKKPKPMSDRDQDKILGDEHLIRFEGGQPS